MAESRSNITPAELENIAGLDKQIATLFECKPLPETEIKLLCDKVSSSESNLTLRF